MPRAERSPAWVEAVHLAVVHVDLTDSLSEEMPEPAASTCRARARTVLRNTEERADYWAQVQRWDEQAEDLRTAARAETAAIREPGESEHEAMHRKRYPERE